VDLAARKTKASEDARPFKDIARSKLKEAETIKARLSTLKKANPKDPAAIATTELQITTLNRAAREATAKAEAIENAVYDLEAVNPNRKAVVDTRTPAELLDLIEAKGKEVAEALAALRAMQ
jgi:type I restriction enzyme M protein